MDILTTDWCRDPSGSERLRLLPGPPPARLDPFISLEQFRIPAGASLAARPCRGQEVLTLVLSGRAQAVHAPDVLCAGDVQRVTSGQGAILQAWSAPESAVEGLRLSMRLPKRLGWVQTGRQSAASNMLPRSALPGGHELVIAGPGSPLRLLTPLDCRLLALEPNGLFQPSLSPGWRMTLYVVQGLVEVERRRLRAGQALRVGAPQGLSIRSVTGSRLFLAASVPLEEPVGSSGPELMSRKRGESSGMRS
jgi:redox-sensitive bicupin YhaK (pirin superfamily)